MICHNGNGTHVSAAIRIWSLLCMSGIVFTKSTLAQTTACVTMQQEAFNLVDRSHYRGALSKYEAASSCYLEQGDVYNYLLGISIQLDCLDKLSALDDAQKLRIRQLQEINKYASRLTPAQLNSLNFSNALFHAMVDKKLGNPGAAIDIFRTRLDSIEQIPIGSQTLDDSLRRAKLLLLLSDAYLSQGNYALANQSAYEAVHLGEPIGPLFLDDGTVLRPLVYLAESQYQAGHLDDTWRILGYVDQIISSITTRRSERAMLVAQSVFNIYLQSGNLDSAGTYLTRLKRIDTDNQHATEIMHMDAMFHAALGDAVTAEKYYRTCLERTRRQFGARNEVMAQLYAGLGTLYLGERKYQQALEALQAGIYCLVQREIRPGSLLDNPPIAEMHSQRIMLQMMADKADAILALYRNNGDPAHLGAAWQTSRLATRYVEQLRSGYSAESDKALLLDHSYPVFERALDIAATYLAQPNAQRWIDTAFVLMEESKALNLRDAILHGEALRYAGIPDSLLQLELALRREIAGKEQLIRTYRSSPFYNRTIEFSYMNDLADARDKFRKLIARYEREHPKYYALKHKPITGSIQLTREALYNQQTLLEYFVGDTHIFLLVVTRDSQQLFRLPHRDELHALIGVHRTSIIDFASDKSQHALTQYATTATRLYELLIPPGLHLDSAILIVPDGVLGYLSFAGLLKTPVGALTRLQAYDFMVRHHDISYCYSAALYLDLHERSAVNTGPVLVCAPDFSNSDVDPLAHSLHEAEMICEMTGGKLLSGPNCTVQAFRESLSAAHYNVLHLATHGSADDASGDLSFLMFSPHGENTGTLYARDLYDMDLPMNLVYLSACETATGELKRGEGIISLARSFFYAGAQSLVTTLWRIEDKRAASLSADFYRSMKSGMRKDRALGTAQRHYLDNLDPADHLYAHPVYWSALIAIGNMHPVEFEPTRKSPLWLILGSLAMLAFLGFLSWQRVKAVAE